MDAVDVRDDGRLWTPWTLWMTDGSVLRGRLRVSVCS